MKGEQMEKSIEKQGIMTRAFASTKNGLLTGYDWAKEKFVIGYLYTGRGLFTAGSWIKAKAVAVKDFAVEKGTIAYLYAGKALFTVGGAIKSAAVAVKDATVRVWNFVTGFFGKKAEPQAEVAIAA